MNKEKKTMIMSLALYFVFMGAILSRNTDVEETIDKEEISMEEVIDAPKQYFNIPTEEYVKEAIERLNIEDYKMKPSNIYKVIRFRDNEGYYKIMIVNAEVLYETNDKGEILDEMYLVKDVFSKEDLFITKDFKNISAINKKFQNAVIISYDKLEELKEIALFSGAREEDIDLIMGNLNRNLTDLDVGIMYVSLIDESNRISTEDLNIDKVKSIG